MLVVVNLNIPAKSWIGRTTEVFLKEGEWRIQAQEEQKKNAQEVPEIENQCLPKDQVQRGDW